MAARRRLLAPASTLLLAAGISACGGGAHRPAPSALLRSARASLDQTPALRFSLTSVGVSGPGADLVGGAGELARPGSLEGTFQVSTSGIQVGVKVIAIGSRFWAVLPFRSTYSRVDPAQFGLTDPGELLSPTRGLANLLTDMAGNARYEASVRLGGELLYVVSGTVAGSMVPVLPDADPSRPVHLTVYVDPTTDQVRQVTLAGPFTSSRTSRYAVRLSGYGTHATISPPG